MDDHHFLSTIKKILQRTLDNKKLKVGWKVKNTWRKPIGRSWPWGIRHLPLGHVELQLVKRKVHHWCTICQHLVLSNLCAHSARRWESLELARIGPHEDGASLKCYHEDLVWKWGAGVIQRDVICLFIIMSGIESGYQSLHFLLIEIMKSVFIRRTICHSLWSCTTGHGNGSKCFCCYAHRLN
jgi:hypothetical protein